MSELALRMLDPETPTMKTNRRLTQLDESASVGNFNWHDIKRQYTEVGDTQQEWYVRINSIYKESDDYKNLNDEDKARVNALIAA
jgi:hypothetical protein